MFAPNLSGVLGVTQLLNSVGGNRAQLRLALGINLEALNPETSLPVYTSL